MKQFLSSRPDQLKIFKDFGSYKEDCQCLSARSLDNDAVYYRVGHFSPNPFKHSEDTLQEVKIRPVIVRKMNPFKLSPKSSKITIRLPEVAVDGSLKLNEFHFPPIKNAKSAKLMNGYSESFASSKKELKKTEKNNKKNKVLEKPLKVEEGFDMSFGVRREDARKANPFLSLNNF